MTEVITFSGELATITCMINQRFLHPGFKWQLDRLADHVCRLPIPREDHEKDPTTTASVACAHPLNFQDGTYKDAGGI